MYDPSLLQDFITESEEHLEEMENYLLRLEGDTGNREILNDIFRCIHTIKGAAEFVGLEKISDFAHRLENLLDILRQGSGQLQTQIIDLLIAARDRLLKLVNDLEVHNEEQTEIKDLLERVDDWIGQLDPEAAETVPEAKAAEPPDVSTDFLDEEEPEIADLTAQGTSEDPDLQETTAEGEAVAGDDRPSNGQQLPTGKPSAMSADHRQPEDDPPAFDGTIPDLAGEEFDDEDNDRELFEIFLQLIKERVEEIIAESDELDDGSDPVASCDRTAESLRVLQSSANYMGYEKLWQFFSVWLAAVNDCRERALGGAAVSSGSMRPFITRVVAHFPRIHFDGAAATAVSPEPPDSQPPQPPPDPTDPAAADGDDPAATGSDQMLAEKLENAFDLFEPTAASDQGVSLFEGVLNTAGSGEQTLQTQSPPSDTGNEQLPAADMQIDAPAASATTAVSAPADEADDDSEEGLADAQPGETEAAAGEKEAIDESVELQPEAEPDLQQIKPGRKNMRVDTEKIDALMNQVGELVVSRSWFSQLVSEMRGLHQELKETTSLDQRELKQVKGLAMKINEATSVLGRVVNDLQDGVMKIRMLPISQLFNRYPRLVRDLVRNTGKNVRLEIKGESTELDKMIIEQMSDPLIHIIRNAVDHGIETVADRKRLGKPEEGTLQLVAYHESNHVVIEIVDDGRGIDPELIRAAAIRRDFIPREDLERMAPKELMGLIMKPGFSTAREVTHTSGRGVGMDVVKKNIEKLNGTIEVDSKIGVETRLRIKIPLTLAIISALLVNVGAKSFAIPLTSVEETLRIHRDQISTVEGFEVIELRNRTLPLLQLSAMFDIETTPSPDQRAYVVIVSTGMRRVGLLVDTLIGQEEVVIKPLADYIQEDSAFSGATILGDGKISLILDVDGLVNLSVRKHTMSRAGSLLFEAVEPDPEPNPDQTGPDRPTTEMTMQ